jgi:hypothetical protein
MISSDITYLTLGKKHLRRAQPHLDQLRRLLPGFVAVPCREADGNRLGRQAVVVSAHAGSRRRRRGRGSNPQRSHESRRRCDLRARSRRGRRGGSSRAHVSRVTRAAPSQAGLGPARPLRPWRRVFGPRFSTKKGWPGPWAVRTKGLATLSTTRSTRVPTPTKVKTLLAQLLGCQTGILLVASSTKHPVKWRSGKS